MELADDLPNHPKQSCEAMLNLPGAWMAMGFRMPKTGWGAGRKARLP